MPIEVRELIIKAIIGQRKKMKLEGVKIEVSEKQYDEIVTTCLKKIAIKTGEEKKDLHINRATQFLSSVHYPVTINRTRFINTKEDSLFTGRNLAVNRMETSLTFEDLVLRPETKNQVDDLFLWLKHKDTLVKMWGVDRKLKPGYCALFNGSPGTGKKLTAALLGKYSVPAKNVYKIDSSLIESKYIGETEKNLKRIFQEAEKGGYILFFEDVDALFGKREQIKVAHDQYVNIEISYFLQLIENYKGLVILASTNCKNIDDSFLRRIQTVIRFEFPTFQEIFEIMNRALPQGYSLPDKSEIELLFQNNQFSSADIMNIMHYCLLKCLDKGTKIINIQDLQEAIKREIFRYKN